jgi:hypothetical protein
MDMEGVSDIYIKCYIEDTDKRTTDTHFRCKGDGSWNYRFLFDLKAPKPTTDMYQLVIQAWDFDLLSKNDYICEWTMNLQDIFDVVCRT